MYDYHHDDDDDDDDDAIQKDFRYESFWLTPKISHRRKERSHFQESLE